MSASTGWPIARTQRITISAEEGQNRTASIVFQAGGNTDLSQYIGKQVVYDYASDVGSGVLFTGEVAAASYTPSNNTITLKCTDNLSRALDNMSQTEIEALIPGVYHDSVFAEKKEGYDYAQQLMKSAKGTLDLTPTGSPRYTPWDVTSVVDFSNGVIAGSVTAEQGGASSIINEVTINVSHRYDLLRSRITRFLFSRAQCDIIVNDSHTLMYEMLSEAVNKVDAKCIGFHAKLIDTGLYNCSGSDVIVLSTYFMRVNDTGHVFEKRWQQNITEKYTVTLKSASSIDKYGEKKTTLNCSLEQKTPDDAWTENQEFVDVEAIGPEQGSPLHDDVVQSIYPGLPTNTFIDDIGWTIQLGDKIQRSTTDDEYNDINAAITAATAIAEKTIQATHRTGRVSFETVINPNVDIDSRGRVNTAYGSAEGKIGRIEYTIDFTPAGIKATQRTTLYLFDGLTGATTPAATVEPPEPDSYNTETGISYDVTQQFSENQGWPLPDTFSGLGYSTTAGDAQSKMAYQIHLPAIAEDLTNNIDFARAEADQVLAVGGTSDNMTIGI